MQGFERLLIRCKGEKTILFYYVYFTIWKP